jgi:hypothetical protein
MFDRWDVRQVGCSTRLISTIGIEDFLKFDHYENLGCSTRVMSTIGIEDFLKFDHYEDLGCSTNLT